MPRSTLSEIKVGATRVPVSSVAWLIRGGTSRREKFYKAGLLLCSVSFFFVLAHAKGRVLTLESILALVPLWAALTIGSRTGIACRGDSNDSYLRRWLPFDSSVWRIRDTLKAAPGFQAIRSRYGNYEYLLNLGEVHSLKRCWQVNLKPLHLAWVFGLYSTLLYYQVQLPSWPVLRDLKLLEFWPDRVAAVFMLGTMIALAGLATLFLTPKQGVKVGAHSGVADKLTLYPEDRQTLLQAWQSYWEAAHGRSLTRLKLPPAELLL
jgi:hypothetical protein